MRRLTRIALTGMVGLGLTLTAQPALARHDNGEGVHAPRPSAPSQPRGLYTSGQLECTVEYVNGVPNYTCPSADNRPEEAAYPGTGPVNQFSGGNNPND